MFERLGRTMYRRRWWVICAAAAFMTFGGRANWWAPGPLRRFSTRHGLREVTA
ncbi:hypothetical protein ABZS66_15930 [Dactylosporangium sp. NPDC005572]|uniref:hypothetical protein n=1 Tax=Dactylosporangium sp. NPDC005572 TaxID=3156889 RepID=UPI0033A21893